ncbi:outer membrane porin protein 32 precursor [mine drainage metagenome]|uniref:Outer membrane porin protein 32 n=1 Tax=mine drainage metagenome TaxID=410659 RepID=A0A1J5PCM3_9ZZZZ
MMKKSLIALAVLAASGAAFAQSTTTVYGVLDTYFGSNKNTDALGVETTQTVLNAGGISHNRWGFKGSEDLGGGLKANFQLEQGFSMDKGTADSAAQQFSRYAYVGLSGSFGEIKLGKTGTAYDDIQGNADAVFDSSFSPVYYVFASTNYIWTPSNSFMYVSPTFGGFSAEFSNALDEKTAGTPYVGSFNIAYAAGPFAASLGYQTQKVYTVDLNDTNFTRLNVAYDFGAAKLMGSYGKVAYNDVTKGDANEYQLGVDVPVSAALTVSGSYAESKIAAVGATAEVKSTGFGLGASYSLSKRTSIYGGYESDKVENTSTDHSLVALGIRHAF